MDELDLRAQLEAHLRESNVALKLMAADEALTDDEYVAKHLATQSPEASPPSESEELRQLREKLKSMPHGDAIVGRMDDVGWMDLTRTREDVLQHREWRRGRAISPDDLIRRQAAELMPFLVAIREETSEHGPLTEQQVHQATHRRTQHWSELAEEKCRVKAETETRPHRKELLERFAQNISVEREALKQLASPHVSQQDVTDFAALAISNMASLTELIKHSPKPTDEPEE